MSRKKVVSILQELEARDVTTGYFSVSLAVTVQFDPASYIVDESDRYANITIVKMEQTAIPVTVNFATADGSATGQWSQIQGLHQTIVLLVFIIFCSRRRLHRNI